MIRTLAPLADDHFDAVVIGGGIYGLSTAHALTQRGLSVALLERRDFGGATSFNSLKTVHGGIRALQHGSLADAREFVRERRNVATLAPHLVRVLPFVVPTARHPIRNRAAMALFLRAYDAVSRDRNAGLDPAVHLPASRTVGRREALDLNPLIERSGVTGGAIWHDYQLHSPERFALALVRTIADAGGAVANYVDVRSLIRDSSNRIVGVRAADTVSSTEFDVRCRVVINAAGPWSWAFLAASGVAVPPESGFSLALNLVLDRPPLPRAVGGIAAGRFLFIVPWQDRSILGTSHEGFHRDPAARPGAADVEALLTDGQTAFPGASLDGSAVRLVHRGLLPARPSGAAHGALLKRSLVRNHAVDGAPGLLTVLGVRYTTARATAQEAARATETILGRSQSLTPPRPLSGAAFHGLENYLRNHPGRERLVRRYGTFHGELGNDTEPIAPATSVTRAELLYAVRHEMALTLADVALRRTDLAVGGHPGTAVLRAAAAVVAEELHWDADRTRSEIAALEATLSLGVRA